MLNYRNPRPFQAQYDGRCTCGAPFKAGARIFWDRSIRRATLCPACAPPKMVHHRTVDLPNGLCASFYKHPTTGEVCGVKFTDPCGAWNASEVYQMKDGKWCPVGCGGQLVFSGTVSHETIVGWLQLAEAAQAQQDDMRG